MLDRSSTEPLYLQIKRQIEQRIRSGELGPGSFLPSEQALCEQFDVSRITVRNAISMLVEEGLLSRSPGVGTRVLRDAPVFARRVRATIAIVVNRMASEFISSVVAGFEAEARERGALVLIAASEEDAANELVCLDRLAAAGVESISLIPCEESRARDYLADLRSRGVHIGLIDRDPGLAGVDYVGSDHAGGSYTAVQRLRLSGFSRFLFVDYPSELSSVRERYEGFRRAISDEGLTEVRPRTHFENVESVLRSLRHDLPVGIVAVNDIVAYRCYQACSALKLSIGDDVGVVGFDNLAQDKYLAPPLSSVAQSSYLIGRRAAASAFERVVDGRIEAERSILPMQLVVRRSSGA